MTSTRGLFGVLGGLTAAALLTACSAVAPGTSVPEPPDGTAATSAPGQPVGVAGADTARTTAPTSSGPVTPEDLLALGEAMTQALAGGEVEEWMALTDLDAAAAQQQRDWFTSVQTVPMDLREMHPTFLVRTDDGQGRATAQFAFRHQVSGVDPVPVLEEYELTLTARGEDWLVAEVAGAGGDYRTYPQLWDLEPVSVAETGRTIVLYAGDPPPRDALRSLDTAVEAVLDDLPLPGDPQLLVEYADAATMGEMVGAEDVYWHSDSYFPVASPEVELAGRLPDVEDGDWGTPRLLVNRDGHEDEADYYAGARGGSPLTRLAVAYMAFSQRHLDFLAPEWVDTGMSWWYEQSGDARVSQDLWADYALGVGDVSEVSGFPPDSYWLFYADDETSSDYQYLAATIMMFLEDEHGRDALVPLTEALALVNISAADADDRMDQVFQDHLGVGRDEVETSWLAWLQEEFGQD